MIIIIHDPVDATALLLEVERRDMAFPLLGQMYLELGLFVDHRTDIIIHLYSSTYISPDHLHP